MAEDMPNDAIALLKADHRKVEALFEEFDQARRSDRKARIVEQICTELKIHTMIEEEIFYPTIKPKIDAAMVEEGVIEHDSAKVLINDLARADPKDEYYDAKVKVLSEEIKHHVAEEERWISGMFAQARRTDVDMEALGARLAARREELVAQAKKKGGLPVAKLEGLELVDA
jgi:signal-transduction protein with cAMP-binding, CBS, and nucleotidyltransferase domain